MKIGIIGTSVISEWLIKTYQQCNQDVYAVFSRSMEKGNKFAEKFGISKVYTRLEDMLDDTELEVIYVASPNSLHYSQAKKALKKGFNVIIEKPVCSNKRELEDLIKTAKENEAMFFEAMTIFQMPNYIEIEKRLKDIKPIKIVEANYSQYSSRYDLLLQNKISNIFDPKFSGGSLMDINIYCISFIVGLFGVPNKATYYPNMKMNIDTSGVAILEYDEFVASSIGSKDNDARTFVQIQGEGGHILVDSKPSLLKSVELDIRKEYTEVLDYQDQENHYYYEVTNFIKYFEERNFEKCEFFMNRSLEVMETLDMLRESAGIKFAADEK